MRAFSSKRRFVCCAMLGLGGMAFSPFMRAGNSISGKLLLRETQFDVTLGIEIPAGSSIRQVAQSNQPVIRNQPFLWHGAPDGGACFATKDNGWIYVSNSEMRDDEGGVSAIRFNSRAEIIAAYPILRNTSLNCAGGRTPWQTWLSCEENGDDGQVYECDPFGEQHAVVRPAMGSFNHEAATVDPTTGDVYMTEDVKDGCLYRFRPTVQGDLSSGILEVAINGKNVLMWKQIGDPSGKRGPLRYQFDEAARFKGGEGIVYYDGQVFFTTKRDNTVWRYDTHRGSIGAIYKGSDYQNPLLTGLDNIEVSHSGELIIAEDGGNMQIVALDHDYHPHALVTVYGQDRSEITGPAFSPDGRRLYFSSQRGKTGRSRDGISYELTMP